MVHIPCDRALDVFTAGLIRRVTPPIELAKDTGGNHGCQQAGTDTLAAVPSHRREGDRCSGEVDCGPGLESRVGAEQQPGPAIGSYRYR